MSFSLFIDWTQLTNDFAYWIFPDKTILQREPFVAVVLNNFVVTQSFETRIKAVDYLLENMHRGIYLQNLHIISNSLQNYLDLFGDYSWNPSLKTPAFLCMNHLSHSQCCVHLNGSQIPLDMVYKNNYKC